MQEPTDAVSLLPVRAGIICVTLPTLGDFQGHISYYSGYVVMEMGYAVPDACALTYPNVSLAPNDNHYYSGFMNGYECIYESMSLPHHFHVCF